MAGSLHAQLGDPRGAIVECAASMTDFQLNQVNLTHGFVSKQLAALSPLKRLPVLEISGRGVTSVPTMLRMIATGSALYSGSPAELAQIDSWTTTALNDFLSIADSWTQPIFGYAEDQPELIVYASKSCMEYLGVLNAHLQNKNFICGDSVSIADIAWAGALTNLFRLVINPNTAKKYAEVTRWFAGISTLPQFISAFGKIHMCHSSAEIPKGIKIPKKFDPPTFEDSNKS